MFRKRLAHVVFVLVMVIVLLLPGPAQAATGYLGDISVYGQDNDGDGSIDVVLLIVPISVEYEGAFSLEVWPPSTPEPQTTTAWLKPGARLLTSALSGATFLGLGTDGPYTLTVELRDAETGVLLDTRTATTPAWLASDFDPAGASITGLEPPWFRDMDGNGLYDALQLNYTLDIAEPGPYAPRVLVANATGVVLTARTDLGIVATGTVSTFIFADLRPIRNRAIDGPYNVILSLLDTYGTETVVVSSKSILTSAISTSTFDPAWAWLLPGVTDEGVDSNADGLLEAIVVHAPVHLGRPATVTVRGNLSWGVYEDTVVSASSPTAALPAGDSVVDVTFPAVGLARSGVDGPYPGNLTLTVAELPGYADLRTFTTAAYHVADLSGVSESIDFPMVYYYLRDPDADGLAEWLDVPVSLQVYAAGDYFLQTGITSDWQSSGSATTGQYLHLRPGPAYFLVRFSGITASRMRVANFMSQVYRLDSLSEPSDYLGYGIGGWIDPALFEGRPVAYLNGTVTSASGDPAGAVVTAVNPADRFSLSAQTNATGGYSLALYDGAFTVLAQSLESADSSVAVNVTVAGETTQDLELPERGRTTRYQVAMGAWDVGTLAAWYDLSGASAAARVYADFYGNFNGAVDATEVGFLARYPIDADRSYPSLSAVPTRRRAEVVVRVNGVELAPGSPSMTFVTITGAINASWPIAFILRSPLQGAVIPESTQNMVSITLPAATPWRDPVLDLHLPPDVASSHGEFSEDVAFTQVSSQNWTLEPRLQYGADLQTSSAWITGRTKDTVAPTAVAEGPALLERAQAGTFTSAQSSDDRGIVNTTWTVDANGTIVHGYAEAFAWTPTEIGTFEVVLRVQDAGGNWDEDRLTVVVIDRTPPAAPPQPTATLVASGASTAMLVSWGGVEVDDLETYGVYRSSDNGTTFAFLGWTDGAYPQFMDTHVSPGTAYLYHVTAMDRYGNEGAPSLSVEAVVPGTGGDQALVNLALWMGLTIVLVVVAIVATIWFMRRRETRPPIEEP